jgi:hypothetical protein
MRILIKHFGFYIKGKIFHQTGMKKIILISACSANKLFGNSLGKKSFDFISFFFFSLLFSLISLLFYYEKYIFFKRL